MKKLLFPLIIGIFFITPQIHSKNLQAFLSYTTFLSPVDGPYIETYMAIVGESVKFVKNENGKYQGSIDITIIFRQGEEIVDFAKYELLSPEVEDTTLTNIDFIDQQRYLLPNGKYDMEIIVSDQNAELQPYITTEPVIIDYPKDKIVFSGVELIQEAIPTSESSSITKSGYNLIPFVNNFYPVQIGKLTFYTELYNSNLSFGDNGLFLLKYYIESFETKSNLSEFVVIKRMNANTVVPIIGSFDLTQLPSGNYNLVLEVRNKDNNIVVSNQLFFQRSNPDIHYDLADLGAVNVKYTFAGKYTSADTLKMFTKFLTPISTQLEKIFINENLADADLLTTQRFFLNFWMTRDVLNPEAAWTYYLGQVAKVNKAYSTPTLLGYDTDRGRVYLKYGPPNIISESYNEPSAYPYEIWQYYSLANNQRNKKFVFYTEDIVTNDFQLVHSDAIGEISNYRWQVVLHRRIYDPNNLDEDIYPDVWGSKVNDYYNNPR